MVVVLTRAACHLHHRCLYCASVCVCVCVCVHACVRVCVCVCVCVSKAQNSQAAAGRDGVLLEIQGLA